ncbi:transposable element Tcb2 transposase [Trichonephila clavipes]|nr:transposable element Tcb2 transposase [Trichonephila clavipes]
MYDLFCALLSIKLFRRLWNAIKGRELPLTPTHRRLRLEWCRSGGNWTAEEWNHVVFNDESRFNHRSDDNSVRVWRLCVERFNLAFALQRHTAPSAGVMVWGTITYNTRSSPNIDPWHHDSPAVCL